MKYKITKQYARDSEHPLAEFSEHQDAIFFIERKVLSDDERSLKLIYRLFDSDKLLKEFNKEKITSVISAGQYASGDRDLPISLGPFKVSKDNSAVHAIAGFSDLEDAELFAEDKLTQESELTTYYIFNKEILLSQLNQRIKTRAMAEEGSQGKGQAASFRPTPLNTSPRPPGTPAKWMRDEKEDEK